MPRIPKPRKWRDKFVTEAGGRTKVLYLIREGIVKARKELSKHLAELELREQEKVTRPDGSIYPSRNRQIANRTALSSLWSIQNETKYKNRHFRANSRA